MVTRLVDDQARSPGSRSAAGRGGNCTIDVFEIRQYTGSSEIFKRRGLRLTCRRHCCCGCFLSHPDDLAPREQSLPLDSRTSAYGNRHRQVVQRRKGYGFIVPDDGSKDLFAHYSEIRSEGYKTLQENQRVSFEVGTGPKGPSAKNIKVSA